MAQLHSIIVQNIPFTCMKLPFVIFDGITWLDLIGVYDPVSRLKSSNHRPDLSWDICSMHKEVKDAFGLACLSGKQPKTLAGYDGIIVPGGQGTRALQFDQLFLDWIRTAAPAKYKISVCTGSLILGAAGFLKHKAATTHYREYDTLRPYCREVLAQRIVDDNDTITAGAVSTSIDLGLYLCKKWAGQDSMLDIRKQLDYAG